jgi:hypothetical protein
MDKIMTIVAAIVLALHGLIHFFGTVVYLKLGTIQGFGYKTTLLGGRWDLGESGMRIFGGLWAVAAIGFVVMAVALFSGLSWWKPILVGVTLFSLVLTALDWKLAFAGVILNIVILAGLWLGPLIVSRFSR